MRVARYFVIGGRVQRVGFRFFTQAAAAVEGVNGWVGNRADGSVEVCAEGEAESMERFERQLRTGPPGARVESVERTDAAVTGATSGFSIR